MTRIISCRVETITPTIAAKWLEKRAPNRPLSRAVVQRYASAMKEGEWVVNGESIKFNKHGDLEDGQHRLQAVVVSGATITSLVTRGLDPSVYETIDEGRPRTLQQMLARDGEPYYVSLAGGLQWLWKYKHDQWPEVSNIAAPRRAQAKQLLEDYPEIRSGLQTSCECAGLLSRSVAVLVYYLFRREDPRGCKLFFEGLVGGENLRKNDPATSAVYYLRQKLLDARVAERKRASIEYVALMITAWRSFRARKVVRLIRWLPMDGNWRERFPSL
jgi:hypothetical protein